MIQKKDFIGLMQKSVKLYKYKGKDMKMDIEEIKKGFDKAMNEAQSNFYSLLDLNYLDNKIKENQSSMIKNMRQKINELIEQNKKLKSELTGKNK
jgi:hypothetical protein